MQGEQLPSGLRRCWWEKITQNLKIPGMPHDLGNLKNALIANYD